MAERHLPRPAHDNERVVITLDTRGKLQARKERISGREVLSGVNDVGELVSGYVIDGRYMLDILGSLKAPTHFFQVWLKLMSLQKLGEAGVVRGYLRTTQRDLQKRCVLPASSVNEAMRYWAHLPWVRPVKAGLYQLNPFLSAAGGSVEHGQWQAEWIAAVGDTFLIPGPHHPEIWREQEAERLAADRALKKARKYNPDDGSNKVVPLKPDRGKTPRQKPDLAARQLRQHTGA